MRSIWLLMLACGCAADLERPEIPPPNGADVAIAAAVESFHAQGFAVGDVVVHWSPDLIELGDGTTAIGAHFRCDDIWVTWWPGPRCQIWPSHTRSRTALECRRGWIAIATTQTRRGGLAG